MYEDIVVLGQHVQQRAGAERVKMARPEISFLLSVVRVKSPSEKLPLFEGVRKIHAGMLHARVTQIVTLH